MHDEPRSGEESFAVPRLIHPPNYNPRPVRGGYTLSPLSRLKRAFHQNRTFKANWICREVPTIAVMVPALGLGAPLLLKAPKVGVLKFVWFRILKNSARNWRPVDSVILVSFARLISRVA